jgi:hypothetical protein
LWHVQGAIPRRRQERSGALGVHARQAALGRRLCDLVLGQVASR